MIEQPEGIALIFRTPPGQDGTVDLSLYCVDMGCDDERRDNPNFISFGWGPWNLDDPTAPETIAFYDKFGKDRLAISINGNDDVVYLTPRQLKAILAILGQFAT